MQTKTKRSKIPTNLNDVILEQSSTWFVICRSEALSRLTAPLGRRLMFTFMSKLTKVGALEDASLSAKDKRMTKSLWSVNCFMSYKRILKVCQTPAQSFEPSVHIQFITCWGFKYIWGSTLRTIVSEDNFLFDYMNISIYMNLYVHTVSSLILVYI